MKDKTVQRIKSSKKRIENIEFDWDWVSNMEPIIDKLNEIIDYINNHEKE